MNEKELQILKIIKYTPPLFILISSVIITLFFYFENKDTFLNEKRNIEQNYIQNNKIKVKEEVNRVYNFIKHLQKTTEIELKDSIKNRVYEAHTIATAIYEKYKNEKSKEEIFEIIKTSLNDIRYNQGRGYFFIDSNQGVKLMQPPNKELEGQSLYDYKDTNGYNFMHDIVKIINGKTEDFIQYYWKNPNTKVENARKISFIKYFEPFDVAIGSGEYVEEFESQIKQKALDYISLVQFGKTGYIFIIDYNGIYLSHYKKDYIGKDVLTNKGVVNAKEVINELINISKRGEGYFAYTQNEKPITNLPTKKISFVKGLNDWNWLIGTGFYEDEINDEIADKAKELDKKFDIYARNIFIISILLTFLLLFASRYMSKFLETKLKEYKDELEKKQNILFQQSKMASMGEMLGNIAHQWRQPLSTISISSTGIMLNKEMKTLDDQMLNDSLEKINKSVQYLSNTIEDFRNFFSPNKIKNSFELKKTFDTTLDLLSGQFKSSDIQIIKNIENITLTNYENELIQALINIINNARDELANCNIEHKVIFIDAYIKDNQVVVKIKDNAGGVPDDIINKIFEPYFTTKHQSQGTGIGLYMTEEIIVRHIKGTFSVKNHSYNYKDNTYTGAEFKIIIPIL
uniref:sensor histidine kinase n=1 Tax=Aliarcobacter sp. TaxID=2321116 RepID=UPI00404887CD